MTIHQRITTMPGVRRSHIRIAAIILFLFAIVAIGSNGPSASVTPVDTFRSAENTLSNIAEALTASEEQGQEATIATTNPEPAPIAASRIVHNLDWTDDSPMSGASIGPVNQKSSRVGEEFVEEHIRPLRPKEWLWMSVAQHGEIELRAITISGLIHLGIPAERHFLISRNGNWEEIDPLDMGLGTIAAYDHGNGNVSVSVQIGPSSWKTAILQLQ